MNAQENMFRLGTSMSAYMLSTLPFHSSLSVCSLPSHEGSAG